MCLKSNVEGKIFQKSRTVQISSRYDAILNDRKRNNEKSFKSSQNNRYKVERRFKAWLEIMA